MTFNELCSAIAIIHEVVSGLRTDIELKPEAKPPHYRQFKVDLESPLKQAPEPTRPEPVCSWQLLLQDYEREHGKRIRPVNRHKNSSPPPEGCICEHCGAPRRYLYLNNGKEASQVQCKICKETSPTHRTRTASEAHSWCPHCGYALYKWKESNVLTIFKCPNNKCPRYLSNLNQLTPKERDMRTEQIYDPNFKLRYQWREYHFSPYDLIAARPEEKPKVDLRKIHRNYHTFSLVLAYSVNIGLSSRQTRDALKGLHGIEDVSHQTVLNYMSAAAYYLAPVIDRYSPFPEGKLAADETYIIVDGRWHYTWFGIDSKTRAICGYNLSDNRGTAPATALLYDCFGKPEDCNEKRFEMITDGNPSYDNAVLAYNLRVEKSDPLSKHTVIGLRNLDPESKEYRRFKQLVERLNRTYKFHTRPRSGFKKFDGAVALTVLFVAFYNFMRPHSACHDQPPVKLDCLDSVKLYPDMWSTLLKTG